MYPESSAMPDTTARLSGHGHSDDTADDRETLPALVVLLAAMALLTVWTGGIRPQALLAGSTLLAAGCAVTAAKRTARVKATRYRLLLGCAAACIGWLAVTAIPLPDSLLNLVRGQRAEIYRAVLAVHEQAREAGQTTLPEPRLGLALNRAGALRLLVLGIGMVSAAGLAATLSERNKRRFLSMLVALGVVVAAGGIFARIIIAPGATMWWWFEIDAPRSFACFANPNHFGAFLAMLCPAAIALGVADIEGREWERLGLWIVALAVMIAGVITSQSRGAYICLVGALLATALLFLRRDNRPGGLGLAILVCVAFLFMAVLGTREMDREMRTLRGQDAQQRWGLWRDQGLRIWRRYPVLGAGPEGYRTVSNRYEQDPRRAYSHHAESTYVQLLADGGMVGTTLAVALVAAYALTVGRRLRRHAIRSTVRIAGVAALSVVAVHGLFDFGLHVPVYGIVAASLAGLMLSNHHHKRRARQPLRRRILSAALPALGCAVVLTVWFRAGGAIYNRDKDRYLVEAASADLVANLSWTPAYWANWYHLGRKSFQDPTWANFRLGEYCLTRAAELNPRHSDIWNVLAQVRLRLGKPASAATAWQRYFELLSESERDRIRRRLRGP